MSALPIRDPVDAEGATFEARYVDVEPGVALRAFRWQPHEQPRDPPVIFVPGWVSDISGWRDLLRAAVRTREVCYIESREKASARIERARLAREDFLIERLAADLRGACAALEAPVAEATLVGSSVGATTILEAMKDGALSPRAAFLIGPNAAFPFPLWARALSHFPAPAYSWIKHIAIFYLRHFRVSSRDEPEQMERYDRTLREAKPERIKLSALAFQGYRVWPRLETVITPVAVAHAGSDTLHDAQSIERIAGTLPAGTTIRCPTNRYMHGAGMLQELRAFESSVAARAARGGEPPGE